MILDYVTFTCGDITTMPAPVANLVSMVINIIKILIPVIVIVMGFVDFLKATTKQKEDEMKKAQSLFIKRVISGLLVFFIVALVQFVFGLLAGADVTKDNSHINCISCFVNGVGDDGTCKK